MKPICYTTGDATRPQQADGPRIISHLCNDKGGWGKGFVLVVSRRWPEPEAAYRAWARRRGGVADELDASGPFGLGEVQFVEVCDFQGVHNPAPSLWVANMVGQHGYGPDRGGLAPVRYDALARCLRLVGERAAALGASVHMPRVGCGLAGGRWDEVEPLVATHLCAAGVDVTVYDPPRARRTGGAR